MFPNKVGPYMETFSFTFKNSKVLIKKACSLCSNNSFNSL